MNAINLSHLHHQESSYPKIERWMKIESSWSCKKQVSDNFDFLIGPWLLISTYCNMIIASSWSFLKQRSGNNSRWRGIQKLLWNLTLLGVMAVCIERAVVQLAASCSAAHRGLRVTGAASWSPHPPSFGGPSGSPAGWSPHVPMAFHEPSPSCPGLSIAH